MGITSIWHWVVVLLVFGLVFGTSRLRNLGADIGQAIKGFRDAIKDDKDNTYLDHKNDSNDH